MMHVQRTIEGITAALTYRKRWRGVRFSFDILAGYRSDD